MARYSAQIKKKDTPTSIKASEKNEKVKDLFREYIVDTISDTIKEIDSLEGKEKVDRRMKLMEYFMPKVQSIRVQEKQTISVADALLGQVSEYTDDDEDEED